MFGAQICYDRAYELPVLVVSAREPVPDEWMGEGGMAVSPGSRLDRRWERASEPGRAGPSARYSLLASGLLASGLLA